MHAATAGVKAWQGCAQAVANATDPIVRLAQDDFDGAYDEAPMGYAAAA